MLSTLAQIKLKSLFIFWVLLILHSASQSVLSCGFQHQSPSLLAKKRKKEEPQPPACLIVQIHLKSRLHESFPKIISSSHVLDKVFVCPESSGQMPRCWVGGRDVVTSSLGMKRAFLVELEWKHKGHDTSCISPLNTPQRMAVQGCSLRNSMGYYSHL